MQSYTEKFIQGSINMIKLIIANTDNYKFSRTDSKSLLGSMSPELICYDNNGEKLFRIVRVKYDPRRTVKFEEMKETETQYVIQMLGQDIILNTEGASTEEREFFKIVDKKIAETQPNNSSALTKTQNGR